MKTAEFWDKLFTDEQTSWGFEPADSALIAKDIFHRRGHKSVLIPGLGYGRNAKTFQDDGMEITGIEISHTATEMARSYLGASASLLTGSVTDMPFDQRHYEAIYCYAVVHLLNRPERIQFIQNCYDQLTPGGTMIFVMISTDSSLYGSGKPISQHRYQLANGLKIYFYNEEAAYTEFRQCGKVKVTPIDEPIKHMKDEPPLKCLMVECRKERK